MILFENNMLAFDEGISRLDAEAIARYTDHIATTKQQDIVEMLEAEARKCEQAGLWANGPEIRSQLQQLHLGLNAAIALIKGDAK